MIPIGEWWRRVWYLLNRARFDEDLRQEMEEHRSSMGDPSRFGNALRLREDARDVWGWRWLDNLARDFRFAIRALRRTPAFTLVTIASLTLGIALVAATASVVNAYLIQSLPYPAADRLFHVMYAPPGPWEPRGISALDWTSVDDVVEFPITSLGETFYLADREFSQAVRGLRASQGFLNGLGVRAILGRSLHESDFGGGSENAALIGYALWRDRYGGDPAVVGRLLRADAETRDGATEVYRIVGILPAGFHFGRDSVEKVDLLVSLRSPARTYMVRLREGVPTSFAERRITEAARRVASGLPPHWTGVHLESVHGRYVAQLRPVLVGVTVASSLVLVIVFANVVVLLLLRMARRQKELAVREALGAGRRHLVRLLLVETCLLCLGALAVALALTRVALSRLAPMIEGQLGRSAPGGTEAIGIDGTVLIVVASVSVVIAVSTSLLPLLARWRRMTGEALRRDGITGTDGRSMRRARVALLAFEVAGTLILFVSCGLMLRSAVGMVHADLGYQWEGVVRTRVILRGADYADPSGFFRFYDQFTERLATATATPVVFTNWPPFFETPEQSIETADRVGHGLTAGAIQVGAGYFAAFRVTLREGRDFGPADVSGSEPVVVISETLARGLWPEGDAIGRRIRGIEQTAAGPTPGPWRTVVGVAEDVRQTYMDANLNDVFIPLSPASFGRFGSFYMRTDRAPSSLLDTIRGTAAELDPHATIDRPRLVQSEDRQLAGARFLAALLTSFAAIAAFLAVLGIYGVTAYSVQQREREMAIRMAVGAAGDAVVWMFLKENALVLLVGLGAGLLGATAAGWILQNRLYGVRAFDLPTLLATSALLAAAGALATWWPARRACLRNPLAILRET